MKNNYTYPMIIDYTEPGVINMSFPDFEGAFTSVEVGEDPVESAQECLALAILDLEEQNKELPETASEDEIILEANQKLVYINVWMPFHRSKIKEVYTKKTLTIPVWLDILAKQNNINFSETLVDALKSKLSLK